MDAGKYVFVCIYLIWILHFPFSFLISSLFPPFILKRLYIFTSLLFLLFSFLISFLFSYHYLVLLLLLFLLLLLLHLLILLILLIPPLPFSPSSIQYLQKAWGRKFG